MEERFLMLMRHGKAARQFEELTDYERPLTERGVRDAVLIHELIGEAGLEVDRVIASGARRARLTGEIIAGLAGLPLSSLQLEEQLYLSETETLLTSLRQLPEGVRSPLLVAHNPGMQELVSLLAGSDIGRFPTSGTALLRFSGAAWDELAPSAVELLELITPKEGRHGSP